MMPNKVRLLIENPNTLIKANVPIKDRGIVTTGISGTPVLQEDKITRITSPIAS